MIWLCVIKYDVFFWRSVAMLYVLALTACNQHAVIDATPTPANSDIYLPRENESQPTTTPMPTNEQPEISTYRVLRRDEVGFNQIPIDGS